MIEYKKLRLKDETFERFHERVLSQYTSSYLGFIMQLQAYLRAKNIDIELNLNKAALTGKNEEFELFELGRKLYYQLSKQEAYSAYDRFTNQNKRENLEDIKILVPNIDDNLAIIIEKILGDKSKRALVFSELLPFISL